MLCKKLDRFSDTFVAIDGSKFKAVNSRNRNFTKAVLRSFGVDLSEGEDIPETTHR